MLKIFCTAEIQCNVREKVRFAPLFPSEKGDTVGKLLFVKYNYLATAGLEFLEKSTQNQLNLVFIVTALNPYPDPEKRRILAAPDIST
uniref:Uncharacterized protein n=1 Tax=Romanomermis culicivorax TaxID=13658 RepID=A0A915JMB3_ROMCU